MRSMAIYKLRRGQPFCSPFSNDESVIGVKVVTHDDGEEWRITAPNGIHLKGVAKKLELAPNDVYQVQLGPNKCFPAHIGP